MRLTLPLPPNRANAREHWRVTHQKKTNYYAKTVLALLAQRPSVPPARLTLTATLYVWNKSDPDNATSRLKWVIDALVNYGLLVDDNEKWLDLQMPKQVIDRKNMRVEIELTPCKPKERE